MADPKRLDAPCGALTYDDIIAGTTPSALTTTVKLATSKGPLERGTVLKAEAADGDFAPVSAALSATDVVVILAEDVDKAEDGTVAGAYKAGIFFAGRLKTDGEYELAAADLEALRKSGLQTATIIEAAAKEGV